MHATTDLPATCENCGTALGGPFCHACGQHAVNPLRHFAHAFEEVFESFWHLDGRAFRTLRDLFVPGRVARNYLAGQRVRYIPPLRLFLVLTVLTFFIGRLAVSTGMADESAGTGSKRNVAVQVGNDSPFEDLHTEAEIRQTLQEQLHALGESRRIVGVVPGALAKLDQAEARLRADAQRRVNALHRQSTAPAAGSPVPPTPAPASPRGAAPAPVTAVAPSPAKPSDAAQSAAARRAEQAKGQEEGIQTVATKAGRLRHPGQPWNEHDNPADISWLPPIGDRWFNHRLANAKHNIESAGNGQDAAQIFALAMAAVPSALFVLVPVFAVLLKLLYIGSRRGYLEHLVVALYSHAFMLVMLLFAFVLALVDAWKSTGAVGTLVNIAQATLWIATPTYLFIMQRRVYGQHWLVTTIKYTALGFAYFFLVIVAIIYTVFAGLTSAA